MLRKANHSQMSGKGDERGKGQGEGHPHTGGGSEMQPDPLRPGPSKWIRHALGERTERQVKGSADCQPPAQSTLTPAITHSAH